MSNWAEQALCAQIDPAIWMPLQGANGPAKAICRRCDVITPCLADAIAAEVNPSGVWGGTSSRDRRALRAAHPNLTQNPTTAKEPTT